MSTSDPLKVSLIGAALLGAMACAAILSNQYLSSDLSTSHQASVETVDDIYAVGFSTRADRSPDSRIAAKLEPSVEYWPPVSGSRYPELVLENSNGQLVRLSDLQGKVILLELAAVPCKGCQAFAGGNLYGGYGGVAVQSDLDSIHQYAKRFGKVDLVNSSDVVFVQLLLFGRKLTQPTREEVQGWAKHFHMDQQPNHLVLRGDLSMVSAATRDMIPGFHLIDRDFVLRADSCGHSPADNLYTDLLPMMRTLIRQPTPSQAPFGPSETNEIRVNPFIGEQ